MVAFKHGMLKTPEYYAWINIRRRCNNPNVAAYPRYGGRGIRVCRRWDDFLTFLADMGRRPSDKCSIDRIDNDGDYEPSNCRWADHYEQAANRSSTWLVTHQGETLCVSEWARRFDIEPGALGRRLARGLPMEEATSRRGNLRIRMLTHKGHTQSLTDWSKELGIKENTLWGRVLKGWSDEKILTHPHGLIERDPEKVAASLRRRSIHITAFGETKTLKEWAQAAGISKMTIRGRLATGMSAEQAVTLPLHQGKRNKW